MKNKYRVIYQPSGAAREYSELALNIYSGCPHGCFYCYVPAVLKRDKQVFTENCTARKKIIDLVQKDLIEMKTLKDNRKVLLCFTCDPYPGDCEENRPTQKVLELFKAYNQDFQLLSKGGMKAARDFHLYKKNDEYAVSLTADNEEDSLRIEPGAPLPQNRINSLKKAKEKGIKTWVSFEPVIYPEQTLNLYERTKDFTDFYKVGKLNHRKNDTDWTKFGKEIIERMEKDGKPYMIKDALKKYL